MSPGNPAEGPPERRIFSSDEALAIAKAYLSTVSGSPSSYATGLSVEDARDVRRCVYGLSVPPARLWAVFVHSRAPALRPSEVVLIEKVGGRVVYFGSAGDEG